MPSLTQKIIFHSLFLNRLKISGMYYYVFQLFVRLGYIWYWVAMQGKGTQEQVTSQGIGTGKQGRQHP